MERTPVESRTGICGIGYDPATETLELEFKSRTQGEPGTLYHYSHFTQADYDAFMAAESKGSHFLKNVKTKFQCAKLGPAPKSKATGALAVIVLFLLAVPAQASPRHWYSDAKWWAGTAVIVGATALDVQSTCRNFGRGYVEGDFVIRGSTSCGEVSGIAFSAAAFSVGMHALAWHCQQEDFWTHADGQRGRCYGENHYVGKHPTLNAWLVYGAIPAIQFGAHVPAAIYNYTRPNLRPAQ